MDDILFKKKKDYRFEILFSCELLRFERHIEKEL